mgnify:CR=1 FL=1
MNITTKEQYETLTGDGELKYIFAFTENDKDQNEQLEKEFKRLKAPLYRLNLDVLPMDKVDVTPCLIANFKEPMMKMTDYGAIETWDRIIVARIKGVEKIKRRIIKTFKQLVPEEPCWHSKRLQYFNTCSK